MKKLLCFALFACFAGSSAFCDDKDRAEPDWRWVVRDKDGKIVGTIENTANGRVVRDSNGKIVGRIDKGSEADGHHQTPEPKPTPKQ